MKFGLTEEQYEKFKELHSKHLRAWESEERIKQHSEDNIEKVEWNEKENVFHVHYKATEHFGETWYHYDTDWGGWY